MVVEQADTQASEDVSTSAETGAATEMVVAPPPPPPVVTRNGVLFALRQPAAGVATHLLAVRINRTCYPICYLRSDRVDLSEWELRQVAVQGEECWYKGWERAVIDTKSVHLSFGH